MLNPYLAGMTQFDKNILPGSDAQNLECFNADLETKQKTQSHLQVHVVAVLEQMEFTQLSWNYRCSHSHFFLSHLLLVVHSCPQEQLFTKQSNFKIHLVALLELLVISHYLHQRMNFDAPQSKVYIVYLKTLFYTLFPSTCSYSDNMF